LQPLWKRLIMNLHQVSRILGAQIFKEWARNGRGWATIGTQRLRKKKQKNWNVHHVRASICQDQRFTIGMIAD
jgi:hypothetical protein